MHSLLTPNEGDAGACSGSPEAATNSCACVRLGAPPGVPWQSLFSADRADSTPAAATRIQDGSGADEPRRERVHAANLASDGESEPLTIRRQSAGALAFWQGRVRWNLSRRTEEARDVHLDDFSEVWLVQFEFSRPSGERPTPLCLTARELRR